VKGYATSNNRVDFGGEKKQKNFVTCPNSCSRQRSRANSSHRTERAHVRT